MAHDWVEAATDFATWLRGPPDMDNENRKEVWRLELEIRAHERTIRCQERLLKPYTLLKKKRQ